MTSASRYTAALVAVCFVPLLHAATVTNEPITATATRTEQEADLALDLLADTYRTPGRSFFLTPRYTPTGKQ